MPTQRTIPMRQLSRAETPTPRELFHGLEFENLQALNQDGTDGAAYCCQCGHENRLTHWCGANPFQKMDCARCGHISCKYCQTTGIFCPLDTPQAEIVEVPCPTTNNARAGVPYGTLCPRCGLSHRAIQVPNVLISKPGRSLFEIRKSRSNQRKVTTMHVNFKATCECGNASSPSWLRFRIGSNLDWRLASNVCYMRAHEQRVSRAVANPPAPEPLTNVEHHLFAV